MKIGVVGVGNMGYAIYKVLSIQYEVIAYDPYKASTLKDVKFEDNQYDVYNEMDIIILCVKPGQILELVKNIPEKKTILSIAAGISWKNLKDASRQNSVVRLMPNLPLKIFMGCIAYFGDREAYPIVRELFGKLGMIVQMDSDSQMDAFTGLAGSGPAFVFEFLQSLAEGGVKSGLTYPDALRISLQTIKGSIALMERELEKNPEAHPEAYKNKVTSPGGTTIHGISAMEKGNFRYSVMDAVYSAYLRASEIGKK